MEIGTLDCFIKGWAYYWNSIGAAHFSRLNAPNHNECYLQYYETGTMTYTAPNNVSFPFKKHYLINISSVEQATQKDTNIAMKWYFDIINEPNSNTHYKPKQRTIETLFMDKNLFMGFDINEHSYSNGVAINNTSPHLCGQDLYEGQIEFAGNDCFHLQYHVRGPSKMYNTQTTFTLQHSFN
eukprot:758622_1